MLGQRSGRHAHYGSGWQINHYKHRCAISEVHLSRTLILSLTSLPLLAALGAPTKVLIEEAHAQKAKFKMKLQETMGEIPFNKDLIQYYATNHGGLNEYVDGNWGTRDAKEGDKWVERLKDYHHQEDLSPKEVDRRHVQESRIFTSADAQRLIFMRLKRVGHFHPDSYLPGQMKAPAKIMKWFHSAVTPSRLAIHGTGRKRISGARIHELLAIHGCFRPDFQTVSLRMQI